MAFIEVVLLSLEVGFAGGNRISRREYGKNIATGCFFFVSCPAFVSVIKFTLSYTRTCCMRQVLSDFENA